MEAANAEANMSGAISDLGADDIDDVYAANDVVDRLSSAPVADRRVDEYATG